MGTGEGVFFTGEGVLAATGAGDGVLAMAGGVGGNFSGTASFFTTIWLTSFLDLPSFLLDLLLLDDFGESDPLS